MAWTPTTAKPSPTRNDSRVGQSPRAPSETIIEESIREAVVTPKGWKPPPPQRTDNANRSKRQAARSSAVEDSHGSVHKPRSTTLAVPEEKRCEALTTRGARCKAPKLRGLRVCMFHGHLAHDDERLLALADPEGVSPPLSPRRALSAVAALRAGELAVAAVDGAIQRAPSDGGASALRVVDSVDPLREETQTLRLEKGDVDGLTFGELTLAVRSLVTAQRDPLHGSTEPYGPRSEGREHPDLDA